eukprot:CAMPEP_0180308176 /NCGR_PEP_ID=MMETSP0988-20121125/28351_1 /TAXON_ID=697907 /ORGANISM="non described non described, Strain CCMP2293" /LENGTH=186 /DNA_ID=CAMNT_0022291721 /DNA_START=1177 /DNA_END=1734 /DNA_ORIENTATION=+
MTVLQEIRNGVFEDSRRLGGRLGLAHPHIQRPPFNGDRLDIRNEQIDVLVLRDEKDRVGKDEQPALAAPASSKRGEERSAASVVHVSAHLEHAVADMVALLRDWDRELRAEAVQHLGARRLLGRRRVVVLYQLRVEIGDEQIRACRTFRDGPCERFVELVHIRVWHHMPKQWGLLLVVIEADHEAA